MELKYIYALGGKSSPKRSSSDHHVHVQSRLHHRAQRNHQKNNNSITIQARSNLLEAIAKSSNGVVSQTEEDGVVKVKIVLRKQDLKQMLQVMGGRREAVHSNTASFSPSFTAEQRLSLMRKKHVLMRANLAKQSRRSSSSTWTPVLQSIPEEL